MHNTLVYYSCKNEENNGDPWKCGWVKELECKYPKIQRQRLLL